jgi:putative DNA primase/helicase
MMDFTTFARLHGVEIGDLYPSERIKRCATTLHPRSKNGAYSWDGKRGWVQAWDGDSHIHWFMDENAKPWTESEKHAWMQKRKAQDSQLQERRRQAAHRADDFIASATLKEHGYLQLKGFESEQGFVTDADELVIPMRSLIGEIQGAQVIAWDAETRKWNKKMIAGMKAKGAIYRFGSKTSIETILCEGYATGLSIKKAVEMLRLRASVLVCFSDSNMVAIAQQVGGKVYVFADNDVSNAGERAAKETGLRYCMSDVIGEDANDLHKRAGLTAVCKKLMEASAMR